MKAKTTISYGSGWRGQSVRHSNARRLGRAGGNYSTLTYHQLRARGVALKPNSDSDHDGVKNKDDCRPLNKKKKGAIHDFIAGAGKVGGYVVGEVGSGVRDIPQEFSRKASEKLEEEKEIEAQKDLESVKKIAEQEKKIAQLKADKEAELQKIQKGDYVLTKPDTETKTTPKEPIKVTQSEVKTETKQILAEDKPKSFFEKAKEKLSDYEKKIEAKKEENRVKQEAELDQKLANAEKQNKLTQVNKAKQEELSSKQKRLDDLTGVTEKREKRAKFFKNLKETAVNELKGSADFYKGLGKKNRTPRTHKKRSSAKKHSTKKTHHKKKKKTEYTLFG